MKHKLEWLEFGRGVAALSVVLCHISWGLVQLPQRLNFVSAWGDWGVSFFFVLSGFIIYHVHGADLGRPSQAFYFARRRFFRIFPTYWLVLACLLTLRASPIGNPEYVPDFGMKFFIENFLLMPGFDPVIPPAWSLRNELLFYGIFLVAIINWRVGLWLFLLWMGFVTSVLVLYGVPAHFDNSAWGIASNALNLFFLAGVAIAVAARRGRACTLNTAAVAAGVAACALIARLFVPGEIAMIGARIGISAAIVSGLVLLSQQNILAPPLSLWMGRISYPIYISHIPAMLVTRGLVKHIPIAPNAWPTISLLGLAICFATAHLISRAERPILQLAR